MKKTKKQGPSPVKARAGKSNGRMKSSDTNEDVTNGTDDENSELKELFVDQLKDIYWAEKHLVKSLPKMAKAATSEELRTAFEDHLGVTEEHVTRLEEVFSLLDEKAVAKKCDGMEGLVKEGTKIIEETEDGSMTRDAALIMAAQKVEHYEIATYGGLRTLAGVLGFEEAAGILDTILQEEGDADKTLTQIAESSINEEASQE